MKVLHMITVAYMRAVRKDMRKKVRHCKRRKKTEELGRYNSAHHLYAENFMLSQTFPVPVQAQRGQRPTLV
jgi:hypothetical protein